MTVCVTVTAAVAMTVAVTVAVAARLPADCRSCISLCCRWLGSRTVHTPPRLEFAHRRTARETAALNMHGARCPSVAGPTAASIGDDVLVMLTTAVRRSDVPIRALCDLRIFAGGPTGSDSVFLCGLS